VSVSAEASPTFCLNVDDSSMVANLRHHAADRVGVRCLIWWRCEGKEKLLLPEAQRLVRIQREIAHGFHRSGLVIAGQYFVFLRYG
jgi:hypothetical protein